MAGFSLHLAWLFGGACARDAIEIGVECGHEIAELALLLHRHARDVAAVTRPVLRRARSPSSPSPRGRGSARRRVTRSRLAGASTYTGTGLYVACSDHGFSVEHRRRWPARSRRRPAPASALARSKSVCTSLVMYALSGVALGSTSSILRNSATASSWADSPAAYTVPRAPWILERVSLLQLPFRTSSGRAELRDSGAHVRREVVFLHRLANQSASPRRPPFRRVRASIGRREAPANAMRMAQSAQHRHRMLVCRGLW